MADKEQAVKLRFWAAARSPVGRKILTGLTGLIWVGFVIIHMLGNLGYFAGGDAYNEYSNLLLGLGPLLYLVELVLLASIIIHAVIGIGIYVRKRQARKQDYVEYRTSGLPSRQTPSSRTMIFTGVVLLVFLFIHLDSFKFGTEYVTTVDGQQMRDLYRLVEEKFQSPYYAFGYTAVMLLLGFHLRHGIWSAFQSLGAMNRHLTPIVYVLGTILAIGIAAGFLILPLYIFFSA